MRRLSHDELCEAVAAVSANGGSYPPQYFEKLPIDLDALDGLPRALDLRKLASTAPMPPQFIVDGWLPCGEVTLFAGHGGGGKSSIALLLAVCIAAGRPFYGLPVQQWPVLYLSLEDPAHVLHWRLSRICALLGQDLAELEHRLDVYDAAHVDGALMAETRDEGLQLTHVYTWLQQRMTGFPVIIIDGASDAFDGREIERRAVRKFIRALRALIPPTGAVVLLAHVDKLAAKAGDTSEGYSGSTAWHNSCRARWYLRREAANADDLILESQKQNHGAAGATMRLRWNDEAHVFVGELEQPASKLGRDLADADEREAIVAALRAAGHVPAAMSGPRTGYNVLSVRPEFPESLRGGKAATKRFWAQIERLRAMGAITEDSIARKDRSKARVLVVATEGRGQCGQ